MLCISGKCLSTTFCAPLPALPKAWPFSHTRYSIQDLLVLLDAFGSADGVTVIELLGEFGSCSVVGAIRLTNPNFDANSIEVGVGFVYMAPDGWSASGSTVVCESGNGPWGGLSAPSGGFYMSIQSPGTYLEQNISGLTAGEKHTVTFWAAHRPGYGEEELLKVGVDGSALFWEHPTDEFTEYSEVFVATDSTAAIRFENVSPSGGANSAKASQVSPGWLQVGPTFRANRLDDSVFLDSVSVTAGGELTSSPPSCTSAVTCGDLGWNVSHGSDQVCGSSTLVFDGVETVESTCFGTEAINGWSHASAICTGVGARLCTVDEIMLDEIHGTECNHEGQRTWTATSCAHGSGYVSSVQGNGDGQPICQGDLVLGLAVRCCADVSGGDTPCLCTSSLSCTELGWGAGRGSDQVCSASNLAHNGVESLNSATCSDIDRTRSTGWHLAAASCDGSGARLCTVAELAAQETRGTGCGHDENQTWASDTCDGGKMSAQGQRGQEPTCQTDLLGDLAVRCCADAVPGEYACWYPTYVTPPPDDTAHSEL